MPWSRRRLVGLGAAAVGWTALRHGRAEPRPNLLLLHCDQLSSWALSCYAPRLRDVPNYGHTLVQTPHLDTLAADGALLTRFQVNSAVCTPSRGCLFTGRYPHAHGAYVNDTPLNADEVTLGQVLRDQGWQTGYAGKWHLSGTARPGFLSPAESWGFEDSRWMFNRGHWKTLSTTAAGQPQALNTIGDERSYTTDFLATVTTDFLRRPRSRPFAWVVSFPDPHTPFTVRAPYDTMYDPAAMPLPRTFEPFSVDGRPVDAAQVRRWKAAYCGLVKCLDDSVGRILATLRETGQLDQTVVVFTTDHGEYLGEHARMHKNQWYRAAYEVPFLVRYPAAIRPGTVVERLITSVDVLPTLCSLLGARPSGREQGQDAAPLLRGEPAAWADEACIHHSSLRSAGLFTPRWELILADGEAPRLYDRLADPEQVTNLAADPAHAATLAALRQRLLTHHRAVASPAMDWLEAAPPATATPADGVLFRAQNMHRDTRQATGQPSFTRLISTRVGLLPAGHDFVLRLRWRSGGLAGPEDAFYVTLRPGDDRQLQRGPLRWRAAAEASGEREERFSSGARGDWNVIVGIYGRGALSITECTLTDLGPTPDAAAED
ncbi:MAG: sulfatase-like hydrolase/transferase [Fimbriimonadaceae bacterium]|nr:sulfatase-like hydrolase/transferase [Fimbriimonadaceae bacterium]